jgi:uncharacterized membrane protein YbhN (UPF0104 family)
MRNEESRTESGAEGNGRRRLAWIQRLGGYALALGGLIWVLHDIHPRELLAHLAVHDWRWIAAAVAADILSYAAQGWRWSLLLSPLGRLRGLRATQAVYAGLFTNEMLPLHAGELVRAYLASRWLNVRLVRVVPSIAVERLLDGIWLALGAGALAVFVPLPGNLEHAADLFGAFIITGVLVFIYLVYLRASHPEATNVRFRFLSTAADGFREIAATKRLSRASLISLGVIVLQALSFWMVMPACGLMLPVWVGGAVFLIVHVGSAIPNAPGNVGAYQFFTVLGLSLFGVDKPAAAAFSFVVFVVLSAPLWIIGFLAFSRSGLTLGRIRTEIHI